MATLRELEATVSALKDELERLQWKFRCPNCNPARDADSISSLKPSEAIIACLREFDRPVGVGHLRQKLESKGYPMRRFGRRYSYFYTLLCRLADKRIERLEGDEVMLKG